MESTQKMDQLRPIINGQAKRGRTHAMDKQKKSTYSTDDEKIELKCMILDKVKDLLLLIKTDIQNGILKKNIGEKYGNMLDEIQNEYQNIKKCASELYKMLGYDLWVFNSFDKEYKEEIQIQDLIQRRILNIAIKIKELDSYFLQDDHEIFLAKKKEIETKEPPNIINASFQNGGLTNGYPQNGDLQNANLQNGDLQNDIDKFITYLASTKQSWLLNKLPENLEQTTSAIKEHKKVAIYSEQNFKDIQSDLKSRTYNKTEKEKMLQNIVQEKENWDTQWKSYLTVELNPRYMYFKKVHEFIYDLEKDIGMFNSLLDRPLDTLEVVIDIKKDLRRTGSHIKSQKKTLDDLRKEALNIGIFYDDDFFREMDNKLGKYQENFDNFLELDNMIKEILEFLPSLSLFKKNLVTHISENDFEEINDAMGMKEKMQNYVAKFDIDKIRKLAMKIYGSSEKVECIIKELEIDFKQRCSSEINEKLIIPKQKQKSLISPYLNNHSNNSVIEVSRKSSFQSNRTLVLSFHDLPKDQYNIQWYKKDVVIDPGNDLSTMVISQAYQDGQNTILSKYKSFDVNTSWLWDVEDIDDTTVTIFSSDQCQFTRNTSSWDQNSSVEMKTNDDESMDFVSTIPCNHFSEDNSNLDQTDIMRYDLIENEESNVQKSLSSDNLSQKSQKTHSFVNVSVPQELSDIEGINPKLSSENEHDKTELGNTKQIFQKGNLISKNSIVKSPPKFIKTFTNTVIWEGDDLVLKCRLISDPETKVRWNYNMNIIKNPRCEMSQQMDEYTLLIHNVQEKDSGQYSITAENKTSQAICAAKVTVRKKDEKERSCEKQIYKATLQSRSTSSQPDCVTDKSQLRQTSPNGIDSFQSISSHNDPKMVTINMEEGPEVEFTKTKTKTVKTYSYSGPSGVNLPGIGFIPRVNIFGSFTTDDQVNHDDITEPCSGQHPNHNNSRNPAADLLDFARFSFAESSDCDF